MTETLHPLEITPQTVKQRLDEADDFLLLDCREPDEFEIVRIPGSKLLPLSELAERVAELETHRKKPIVVHCHHGGRSLKVAHWLTVHGFCDVASMAGGVDRWAIEIDPGLPRY